MLNFYEKNISNLRGYLTDRCDVNLSNLEDFFRDLSHFEHNLLEIAEEDSISKSRNFKERGLNDLKRLRYDIGSVEKRHNLLKKKNIEENNESNDQTKK